MKSYSGVERQISSEEAYERIVEIIRLHKLVLRTLHVGSDIKTFQAVLIDESIKKQFIGCGKGIGIQSKVSAIFEAFEHYISYITFHDEKRSRPLLVAENPALTSLIDQQILPRDFVNLIGGPGKTIPWIELSSLQDDQVIRYPLFLAEPRYNATNKFGYDDSSFYNLSHLSNGSGCASGSAFDEAMVHALNEVIERDATSLFLYNGFIRNNRIRIVDKATIPDSLGHYLTFIEREYDDELFIIDITSDIGVPCFCVTFSRYDAPIMPKGYGASLCTAYALERALLESLQPIHLRNERLNRVESNTVSRLERYPILQRAAVADIREIIRNGNFVTIDFLEIQDYYHGQDLAKQKDMILSLIHKNNFNAYYHKVCEIEGYSQVKVLMSGSSQLCFVQVGKLILPDIEILDKRAGSQTETLSASRGRSSARRAVRELSPPSPGT